MASQRDTFGKTSYSRFEDLFAASPRAKEIFASASKRPKNEPRSNSSSNLETNLHLQSPPFKSKYEAGKFIKNLPDQPKECNSGGGLTGKTPELIGNKVVSKPVQQKQDSFGGNDMFFGIKDDDIIDSMDTLTRNVTIVLKKLDEAKKVGSEEKVTKEIVKKEQILYNWSLRTVETNNEEQIIVEGHRRGDPEKQNWRSTVICKRISSQTVMTKSGSLYRLSGKIDVEEMAAKGFSKQLINAFKSGFPRNWERLLQSRRKDVQSLEKKPGDVVNEKKSSPQSKLNVRRSARGQNKKKCDKPVNDKTGKMKRSEKVKRSEKMKTSEEISQHRQNNSLKKSGFKTPPASVFPKDAEVKRSRSGRIIAPPLEYWRGQRMIGSNLDDTISIVQSHLEENSVQFVKRPTPLSKFWKESLKNKKEPVTGQSCKRVCTGLTFAADSMTTDCVTSSDSVDCDYQPITTVAKTLTYASTDSAPPEDYNIPRKISRKEHQTSEKSNEYETETSETLGQSNELRSEIAKEMFGQQSKKTKTSNAIEKEAPPLVELGANQEEMATSDGVTEDDHHENEDAPQRIMYSLRSREKKVDSRTDIVSKPTVSKFARNASTTSGRSQRRGRPSKLLDSNNKIKVLRTRNRKIVTSGLNQKGVTTTTEGMEKKPSDSSCVMVIDTTAKRQNNEDINSSKTERRNIKLINAESSDTEVGETICGRSNAESKDERSKRGRHLNSITASDHEMVVGKVDTSEAEGNETKHVNGKIGGKTLRENHSVLFKYMSSSKDEDISDSVPLSKTSKSMNRNAKYNMRLQTRLQHETQAHGTTNGVARTKHKGSVFEGKNDCEVKSKKSVSIVAQKARTNKNIGKKSANDQLCDHVPDDEMWSEDENGRLIHALNQVPPTAAMYWQMVAQLVKTRSAKECQHQIQNDKGSKRPKKKISRKMQGKPVPEKLTAKVGTLARKRQLRDILEQQDDGYEDDLFDSTPFRNQGLIKFSPVNFDDEDFIAEDMDTDPAKYKTPSSRTPMNRLRPAGPLSASGTSETEHISPALLKTFNRNEVDRYVHQLKKRKVGCRIPKQTKSHTPLPPKKISAPHPLSFDANDCFDIREDSCTEKEEDEDYYWSDV